MKNIRRCRGLPLLLVLSLVELMVDWEFLSRTTWGKQRLKLSRTSLAPPIETWSWNRLRWLLSRIMKDTALVNCSAIYARSLVSMTRYPVGHAVPWHTDFASLPITQIPFSTALIASKLIRRMWSITWRWAPRQKVASFIAKYSNMILRRVAELITQHYIDKLGRRLLTHLHHNKFRKKRACAIKV